MELGFWIPIVIEIPDSGFQSPRFQIPHAYFSRIPVSISKNFSDSLTWSDTSNLLPLKVVWKVHNGNTPITFFPSSISLIQVNARQKKKRRE